jgi:hypothetical protein
MARSMSNRGDIALSKTPDENQMISLAAHMNDLRARSVTVIVEGCSLPTEFAEIVVTNTARAVLLDLMKRFYAPFFPSEWGWPPEGRGIRGGFLIHPARINFKLNMILRICDPLLKTESAGWLTNIIQKFDDIFAWTTNSDIHKK